MFSEKKRVGHRGRRLSLRQALHLGSPAGAEVFRKPSALPISPERCSMFDVRHLNCEHIDFINVFKSRLVRMSTFDM